MDLKTDIPYEQTGVIISGGGPTGALLSALLGRMNVPNVVLEREEGITTDPRGIALDEDGIRILQSIGVFEKIFLEIGSCMQRFNFISGRDADLSKPPMISVDYNTSEGGTGHVGFICHKQPALEKVIRQAISANPHSQLKSKSTVTAISEGENRVCVQYIDANGQQRSIQAPFLVGADGKTGYVRKKYLEPKGVTMDRCEGTKYQETWVALNWKISLPTEKTHPDFPLWRLGYSPDEVYDLFFPQEFRFLCNPDRPAVCGRFGLQEDRLWRFEFVVHTEEDGMKMASSEEAPKIISPYITHPGNRYGLAHAVRYPEDCIETLRSRPFSFSARSCNKWALGRVIIVGDAAHVFPPFGGQGIASGFRDASALAWRLALLQREPKADHEKVLTAWYLERKQQLERSLAATIRNGAYVTEADPFKVFIRDWSLWLMQFVPRWKRHMEKGPRAGGMARYKHQPGLPFLPDGISGLLLPQVYGWNFRSAQVAFSDDFIFSSSKRGLFQLLLLPDSPREAKELLAAVKKITQLCSGYIITEETSIFIQDHCAQLSQTKALLDELDPCTSIARVATGEEFAADATLCRNRPSPQYYDPYRISKEVKGMKYVVVRPDRFVYAACRDGDHLIRALEGLVSTLLF